MLPPPLPQPRLALYNQPNIWPNCPPRFILLDRLYNLFPVVQESHLQGNQDLSMAPPGFFDNNCWTIDQLRALIDEHDRVHQQAPAQQVQLNQQVPAEQVQLTQQAPDQQDQQDQAELAPQASRAIPTWQILHQVSPFDWGLAEVIQVRKFGPRASPTDRMLTGDSGSSLRHHPVHALLGGDSPRIDRPWCSGFIAEQSNLHRVLLRNEDGRVMRPMSSQLL
jgi:hypothetical protein